MAQEYKTFDELPSAATDQPGEAAVWSQARAKKLPFTAFFAGLFSLIDAAAWRSALGIADVMQFKGVIAASGNPNYPAAAKGDVWKISVAGKIGGAAGVVVEAQDTIYAIAANAGGTQAAVGASWDVIQANIDGAVTGPSVAVDSNIAVFNGTTGKVVKDGGKTLAQLLDVPNFTAVRSGDSDQGSLSTGASNLVKLNAVGEDSKGWFDTVNFRYTPLRAGLYHFDGIANVAFTTASVDSVQASIYKNGALALSGNSAGLSGQTTGASSSASGLIRMNGTTDYVDLRCYCPTNASAIRGAHQQTYLHGHRVAD